MFCICLECPLIMFKLWGVHLEAVFLLLTSLLLTVSVVTSVSCHTFNV